jgi:hypothetical protein
MNITVDLPCNLDTKKITVHRLGVTVVLQLPSFGQLPCAPARDSLQVS